MCLHISVQFHWICIAYVTKDVITKDLHKIFDSILQLVIQRRRKKKKGKRSKMSQVTRNQERNHCHKWDYHQMWFLRSFFLSNRNINNKIIKNKDTELTWTISKALQSMEGIGAFRLLIMTVSPRSLTCLLQWCTQKFSKS